MQIKQFLKQLWSYQFMKVELTIIEYIQITVYSPRVLLDFINYQQFYLFYHEHLAHYCKPIQQSSLNQRSDVQFDSNFDSFQTFLALNSFAEFQLKSINNLIFILIVLNYIGNKIIKPASQTYLELKKSLNNIWILVTVYSFKSSCNCCYNIIDLFIRYVCVGFYQIASILLLVLTYCLAFFRYYLIISFLLGHNQYYKDLQEYSYNDDINNCRIYYEKLVIITEYNAFEYIQLVVGQLYLVFFSIFTFIDHIKLFLRFCLKTIVYYKKEDGEFVGYYNNVSKQNEELYLRISSHSKQ